MVDEKEKKLCEEEREDPIFLGAYLSDQEMDMELKRLYDSLINYKEKIFHLVNTFCNDYEDGNRLAMRIAERDSALLKSLVDRECEQRRMRRKTRMSTRN